MASADRHDWNALGNYLLIHERRVQAFVDEGYVLADGLQVTVTRNRHRRPAAVKIKDRLTCKHDLFVDVEKTRDVMERDGRAWVRIGDCKYHAGVIGDADRAIFRYDTSHPYPDHLDSYHKHLFEHTTWQEIGSPIWIGRGAWPHLSEVLEELQAWWRDIGQNLGLQPGTTCASHR